MSKPHRRYEVLLPMTFNDGRQVPGELIGETLLELKEKFGPVSFETQAIRGIWPQDGETQHDELVRVFVDVPDLPENREFFIGFKQRLKQRFEQEDIWITTHAVEVL